MIIVCSPKSLRTENSIQCFSSLFPSLVRLQKDQFGFPHRLCAALIRGLIGPPPGACVIMVGPLPVLSWEPSRLADREPSLRIWTESSGSSPKKAPHYIKLN